MWHGLDRRVLVVLEKEALAGVVGTITEEYDIPLLVTRGFSSLTFAHGVAEDINSHANAGITTHVYALGDWDPSGIKAHASFRRRLKEWSRVDDDQYYGFVFSRLAVTPAQITQWSLPSRPTKPSTHAADWEGGDSVELDAVSPGILRQLVRDAIEQHLPAEHMQALQVSEESEREILRGLSHKLVADLAKDKQKPK